MEATLALPGRRVAKRLLLLQSGVVLAAALLATVAVGVDWGISALIGGGICVIANAAFAACAFLFAGARKAKLITASFYGGEVLKILLTVLLFTLAYLYVEVALLPLKLTYLLALGVNLFAPVLFINHR